jgi:hypothetical protein
MFSFTVTLAIVALWGTLSNDTALPPGVIATRVLDVCEVTVALGGGGVVVILKVVW